MPAITSSTVMTRSAPSLVFSTIIPTLSFAPASTNQNLNWSAPVIIGVILAVLAIVVGVPSAVVAIKKLRLHRQATFQCNGNGTDHDHSIGYSTNGMIDTGINDGDVPLRNLPPPEPAYLRVEPNTSGAHSGHERGDIQTPSNANNFWEVAVPSPSTRELPTATTCLFRAATAPVRVTQAGEVEDSGKYW
jgi:hypothetical protein